MKTMRVKFLKDFEFGNMRDFERGTSDGLLLGKFKKSFLDLDAYHKATTRGALRRYKLLKDGVVLVPADKEVELNIEEESGTCEIVIPNKNIVFETSMIFIDLEGEGSMEMTPAREIK